MPKDKKRAVRIRPAVVILATEVEDGEFIVTVVPITTSPSADPRTLQEIAPQTKKRLRLDDRRSFIVLKESEPFSLGPARM